VAAGYLLEGLKKPLDPSAEETARPV